MRTSVLTVLALLGLTSGALAQAPLSAIDWLSEGVASDALPTVSPQEEAVSGGAAVGEITVTSLDAVSTDAVGLLPASVAGLPRDLWGDTPSNELARLLRNVDTGRLPALQDLLFTLLLAELDPPADSDPTGKLFLARIDKLMALGAVEQAQAMLERAGPDNAARFTRWFDASLLTGTEDTACARLRAAPNLSNDLPARIFCLARGKDWDAAALTLETGRALGEMTGAQDAALTRFLDPDLFEGAPPLPVPSNPSPLMFRLFEAIGESLPTTTLPLAFSQADLRSNTGWKAQIEAAERLARSGALAGNKLLGLYTERLPAASGGVWDRVGAVQRFDIVLTAGAAGVAGTVLPHTWAAMQSVGLEAVFANLYAERLNDLEFTGDAAALAFRMALLARDYRKAAEAHSPVDAEERFLRAIALGDMSGMSPHQEVARAIADGFRNSTAPGHTQPQDLGAALLHAINTLAEGARGDVNRLSEAITTLRALGFEDAARRAALQVMILDRRG